MHEPSVWNELLETARRRLGAERAEAVEIAPTTSSLAQSLEAVRAVPLELDDEPDFVRAERPA